MTIIISAFKIIFLLGFLIFIHEGGHFLAARLFDVKVEEFSIGFGKKIFKKKKGDTEYSIALIPFGGYVKMTGETEKSTEPRAFNNAKLSHRIAIVSAGAIVNIVFGILVYFILSMFSGFNISTTVSRILPEAVDNISQIQVGDRILKINDVNVRLKTDITKALENYKDGETLKITVERNNENVEVEGKATKYQEGIYILGVEVSLINASFKDRLYYSFWETASFVSGVGDSFKAVVTGNVGLDQMSGPIGISEVVAKSRGSYDFIYLLCLISISLGITNLLPIPALDGGTLIVLLVEGIRRKPLDEEIEFKIQSIGFTLLILFSLYVTCNDIMRLFEVF